MVGELAGHFGTTSSTVAFFNASLGSSTRTVSFDQTKGTNLFPVKPPSSQHLTTATHPPQNTFKPPLLLPPTQPHPHYSSPQNTTQHKPLLTRQQKTMPAGSEKPTGWTAAMTAFLKHVLANGEDNQSAIILLETEFPAMAKQVKVGWVERVRKGEVA
ncbi:MAG: hypothetical protein L6R36_003729 [Xanthoria steineri]|nr:MAG: hypothetical protein L6R36_003729 [Xanthoria steineri]